MWSSTLRGRFAITATANLLKSILSFLTGILLARGLGPEAYGMLVFLLGISLAIRQLLDFGTSSAFFTFLSQRQRSRKFVEYYLLWLVVQIGLPVVAILHFIPDSWVGGIWHSDSRQMAALALLASFLQNGVWPTILQMGESQRETRKCQVIGLCVACAHLLAIVAMWKWSMLGIILVLVAIIIEYVVASWMALSHLSFAKEESKGDLPCLVVADYARYCAPLIPYGWIGFAYTFVDTWLLQRFGGSIEQAYYGFGLQFASISVIIAASIQNAFWKEIAEANHRGDMQRVAHLYRRVSRVIYFTSAVVAGLVIPWTEEILSLTVGKQYADGAMVFAILCLYPVQQSMAHVETTMLMATERVRVQVMIGIWFMLTSMVVTYFVLAPTTAAMPGLGLASTGLAAKMVVMVSIQIAVMAIINSRFLNIDVDWHHRVASLLVAAAAGWLCAYIIKAIFINSAFGILILFPAAGLYAVFTVLFLYAMPWLVDANRDELKRWSSRVLVARR